MTIADAAMAPDDLRRQPAVWTTPEQWKSIDRRLRVILPITMLFSISYFIWLLTPGREGNRYLFWALIAAQLFNFIQAVGFWWTCWPRRDRPAMPEAITYMPTVDVVIPIYNEDLDVVAPTVAAATAIRGAAVTVWLLDDAGRTELAELAKEWGARYIHREESFAAKAGNINNGLKEMSSQFVAIFDCDHVPDPTFLERTMGWMENPDVAIVQTPQYYSNAHTGRLAAAATSQQDLFFGAIARGKDRLGSMICCGTNFVVRRSALDEVGGFPTDALTEDFVLSMRLQRNEWETVYVNEVLARGLAPEDMSSYVSQQIRWSRGCVAAIGTAFQYRLPRVIRLQYLFSSMFFLTGWTIALYIAMPVLRIFTGLQPFNGANSAQMLANFAPYFCLSLIAVAVAGGGSYTFDAYCLFVANFWIQLVATYLVLTGTPFKWIVTPKSGSDGREPGAVKPAIAIVGLLAVTIAYGLWQGLTPSIATNIAFALLYAAVIVVGMWPALVGNRSHRLAPAPVLVEEAFEDQEEMDVLLPELEGV